MPVAYQDAQCQNQPDNLSFMFQANYHISCSVFHLAVVFRLKGYIYNSVVHQTTNHLIN